MQLQGQEEGVKVRATRGDVCTDAYSTITKEQYGARGRRRIAVVPPPSSVTETAFEDTKEWPPRVNARVWTSFEGVFRTMERMRVTGQ